MDGGGSTYESVMNSDLPGKLTEEKVDSGGNSLADYLRNDATIGPIRQEQAVWMAPSQQAKTTPIRGAANSLNTRRA
jgi:hypothetical protein